jgi:hypothetical protein
MGIAAKSGFRVWRTMALAGVLAGMIASAGCAAIGAKPWERDLMAEQAMLPDPHPVETSIDDHIYFSKEASSGGRSYAGGGCGCN